MKNITAVSAGLLLTLLVSCATSPLEDLKSQYPSSKLSVQQVVEIQLQALQFNNRANEGIEIVYRFAAPSNRVNTGPLDRFATLFSSGEYAPMLNADYVELLDFRRSGDMALQGTLVRSENGAERYYLFILQRQTRGAYKDCWMTVGVQTYSGELPGNDLVPESQSI